MAFVSWEFTAFVIAAWCVHRLLPPRLRHLWLLFVSYSFYAACAWPLLPVLVLSTCGTHVVAGRVLPGCSGRRVWLWVGILGNAVALLACRHAFRSAPFVGPFIVLGLSFFTLQAISYLCDLYSGRVRGRHTLLETGIYLAYFPKLAAGPIEPAPAFFSRLAAPRPLDNEALARAAVLVVVGVTRQLVIAYPLSRLVSPLGLAGPAREVVLPVTALIVYAFVLYNDFAGYTSIARGVSLLFGIELTPNFAQPFFATSFTDFWNRWHISLSHWLRDYVYLPLSRALLRRDLSRWNVPNLLLPPMVTMLISGLWHGGTAGALVWGALHGSYLIGERLIDLTLPGRPAAGVGSAGPLPFGSLRSSKFGWLPGWRLCGGLVTFALSCFALTFLRLDNPMAVGFWTRLFASPFGPLSPLEPLLYILASLWLDWMQSRHGEETVFLHWPRPVRSVLLAVAILLWFLMVPGSTHIPYVYRGF